MKGENRLVQLFERPVGYGFGKKKIFFLNLAGILQF